MIVQFLKEMRSITLLFCISLIIFSCQKDIAYEPSKIANVTREFEITTPNDFSISDWIDCYNEVSLRGVTFEKSFGIPLHPIRYVSRERKATIFPLIKENQIKNVFYVTNGNNPIIINRNDVIFDGKTKNNLPRNLMEIFNLSIADLGDNSDLINVGNKLKGKYEISKEDNVI